MMPSVERATYKFKDDNSYIIYIVVYLYCVPLICQPSMSNYHVDTVSRPSASLHRPETFSMAWFCLSVVFCGLSVLCKEQGITVIVSIEGERQRERVREREQRMRKTEKKSQRK